MRKEIRRIAAILVAGCLLTGVLCASFAEDTGTPFVSESNTVTIEAAAGELPAVTTETDGTADPAVTEEAAESGDPEEIPEQPETPTVTDAEGYVHFIDNGNTEYREIDDGGGSIEPETVAKLVPEVTEEMKEASGLTGGKPDEEPAAEEPAVRAWITDIRDENNAIILKANAIPSLNGKVIWQIHDRSWPEGTWEEIGNGELLTLDLEEVNDGALVCFRTEDGLVSEPFEIKTTAEEEPVTGEPAADEAGNEGSGEAGTAAGEAPAETPAEGQPAEDDAEAGDAGDGETAGEQAPVQNPEAADTADEETAADPAAEETADGTDGSEPAADTDTEEKLEPAGLPEGGTAAEGTGEDPAGDGNETPGEEPGEPTTLRAWITGPDNAQAGETVTLNANAEPELTGVSTWQIRNEQVEGGKWKKAGYGDHLTVELAEGDEYRFVMQDGTVSEVLQLCRAPEKAAGEDTGEDGAAEEAGETTGAPAAEEPDEETGDTEEPKETGDTADPGDDPEESGDGAEGTAAEPEGEMSEGTGDTEESGNEPEEPGEGAGETAAEAEGEPGGVTGEEETGDAEDSGDGAAATGDGAEETTAEPEEPKETGDTADPGDDPEETGDGTEEAAGEPEDEMTGEIGEPEGNEEPGVPEENEENGEAAEPEDGGAADEPEESEEPEEPAEGAEGEGTEESEENSEGEEPEEPAGDGEDAEAEEPAEEPAEERALPENRSAVVSISWDDEHPGIGSVAHFSVLLTGYEELNYTVQWIMSTDNENWTEVEGATGETMDVVVTEDNYLYYWRIRIHIEGFKDVQ